MKSVTQHRQYLAEIIALKLWFVCTWLNSHPDEDLPFVLRYRVDVLRKTIFWRGQGFPTRTDFDVSGWLALEGRIQRLYERRNTDTDPSTFERHAFRIVWESVEPNVRYHYQASLAKQGFQCDSLGFSPPSAEDPGLVHVHITNALQPRSFFGDSAYLPECFLRLMNQAETEHGADRLGIGTWLNSYPRWLALFPEQYLDNMEPKKDEIWCGLGYWGQFVNAHGTFHEKRGKMLRDTGNFPYPRRYSWCSFKAMRAHLSASRNP